MSSPLLETSLEFYLGGLAALNLPSKTGSGDWHFLSTFSGEGLSRGFYSGTGCEIDTNHLFGRSGIFECSHLVRDLGLSFPGNSAYAAGHVRAVADFLIDAVINGKTLGFVTVNDWLHEYTDLRDLSLLIDTAVSRLTPEEIERLNNWRQQYKLNYVINTT